MANIALTNTCLVLIALADVSSSDCVQCCSFSFAKLSVANSALANLALANVAVANLGVVHFASANLTFASFVYGQVFSISAGRNLVETSGELARGTRGGHTVEPAYNNKE